MCDRRDKVDYYKEMLLKHHNKDKGYFLGYRLRKD